MARPRPLIAVDDVLASSSWYAQLLRLQPLSASVEATHGNVYNRLLDEEGQLVLQLHSWDDEQHPGLMNRDLGPTGHGHLLWFEVDDFDAATKRAKKLKAELLDGPLVNPGPRNRELWLRDPDGYVVVIASPDGEAR